MIEAGIIALVVIGGFIGYYRGVTVQIASLVGILLGVLSCRIFGDWCTDAAWLLCPGMEQLESSDIVVPIMARIILFFLVYLAVGFGITMLESNIYKYNLDKKYKWTGVPLEMVQVLLLASLVLNIWQIHRVESGRTTEGGVGLTQEVVTGLFPSMLGADRQICEVLNAHHN